MNTGQKSWNVGLMGECMIELQGQPEGISMTFGGDTLNTAVYLARLGAQRGVATQYITAVGEDHFSASMLAFWQAEGVGTAHVRRLPHKLPGLYFIELEEGGERVFSYWRGEAAAKECFELPGAGPVLDALGSFDALYLSGISLGILHETGRRHLLQRLRQVREKGVQIIFDFNYRPRIWGLDATAALHAARPWYEEILTLAHTCMLTRDEAPLLDPAPEDMAGICRAVARFGPTEVVVKEGEKESYALLDGEITAVAPPEVPQVVDTTAAGDSFSAAYLLARHLGFSARESLTKAHQLAGTVIAHRGAVIPAECMPALFENLSK